jgi:hypothetical protein
MDTAESSYDYEIMGVLKLSNTGSLIILIIRIHHMLLL